MIGSVVTFSGLAVEIARRVGCAAGACRCSSASAFWNGRCRGFEFEVLAGSASAPGFAAAAGELIAELQRSLITPQRFAQALKAWAAQDERRMAYAQEVASLYRAYTT